MPTRARGGADWDLSRCVSELPEVDAVVGSHDARGRIVVLSGKREVQTSPGSVMWVSASMNQSLHFIQKTPWALRDATP